MVVKSKVKSVVKPKSKPKKDVKVKRKYNVKDNWRFKVLTLSRALVLTMLGVLAYEARQHYLDEQELKQTEKERKETLDKMDEYFEELKREYEEYKRKNPDYQRRSDNGYDNDEHIPLPTTQIDTSSLPEDVQEALRELYSKTDIVDIERYCRQIQRKYHPQTQGTGNAEKSKIINAECDKRKGK